VSALLLTGSRRWLRWTHERGVLVAGHQEQLDHESAGVGRLRASSLLGEKTDRGGGMRASGPAQPSPGHGERRHADTAKSKEENGGERKKGGRAHLGNVARRRGTSSGARLRRRVVARS
jgi:hypothetical protein